MDKDIAISVENVTMSFILNKEKVDNLKEYAIKLITGKLEYNKFDALKDINFKVKKGEHLAIMGLNGAGKSTFLKVLSGDLEPARLKSRALLHRFLNSVQALTVTIPAEKTFSFTVPFSAIQGSLFSQSMMKLLNFQNSAIS